MKHLLAALLLAGQPALAATYYLAGNGDDSRPAALAQNPATPWQSLARLNAAMPLLQPGDQVLLRRGDVFRGQLVISRSGASGAPLTFGAYGPAGPAPVLSGSVSLRGWASAGPNLWEARCPAGTAVGGLYTAAGAALPLGRYPNPDAPNRGYLTIAAHTGNTALTAPALGGNWAGATAVVRSIRWVLDRAPVTGQTGTTLTLGAFESPYYTRTGLPNGWGFFLQNHPATLDQEGEWYYDPARAVLRLCARRAPANDALEATTAAPAGVVIRNQQYLTFENLTLAHTPQTALECSNVAHLTVRGVQVLGAADNGVLLTGSGSDVLLEDNLWSDVNNNAVAVDGYTDFTFRRNVLRRIGVVPGRGRSGDGQYYAFQISRGNRVVVEDNTLDSCGYVGLAYFGTSNIHIARNVVSNFCLVKDDGGGIYTYNGGTPYANVNAQIVDNVVRRGVGAPQGTDNPNYVPAYGIYLDDCSRNATVQHNTVAECRSGGIFMHGNSQMTVSDNTCFNNGAQVVIQGAGPCASAGLLVQNNVLVTTQPDAMIADYHIPPTDLAQLGTLRNNYYAQPFADVPYLRYENQSYLLNEWQALARQDAGSTDGPAHYRPYRVQSFAGPERLSNGTFAADVNGWGSWASSGGRVLNWDNTNALGSGGSLRLAAATPSAAGAVQAQGPVGAVGQGRSYVVRFAARSTAGPKLLEIFLQQGNAPYADLTASRRVVALGPTARNYEVTFAATATDTNVLLTMQGAEDSRPVWLDNVSAREALLSPASPADSVRFEYNATAAPRVVALPPGAYYLDVRRAPYFGSLSLAPYRSVVLFRVGAAQALATRPSVAAGAPVLWPNPTADACTLDLRAWPTGSYSFALCDLSGRLLRRCVLTGGQAQALTLAGLPPGIYLLNGPGPAGQVALRVTKE